MRSNPPLLRADLQRRLTLAFDYYALLRPHEGLAGATPVEVYLGKNTARLAAVTPPRARRGEGTGIPPPPFKIHYLDPEHHLPYLDSDRLKEKRQAANTAALTPVAATRSHARP